MRVRNNKTVITKCVGAEEAREAHLSFLIEMRRRKPPPLNKKLSKEKGKSFPLKSNTDGRVALIRRYSPSNIFYITIIVA